jgi:hypothetical protein
MGDQHALDEIRRSYSTLGVPETASPEEIHRRYVLLAKEWHPDKSRDDPLAQWRATEKMKRVNEAFARIKDAPLRRDPAAPSPGAHTTPPDSSNDPSVSRAGNVTVFITSDALTSSDLLIAGWIGLGLGLYAFGDSLLALLGVTIIREAGAPLHDIRQLSKHGGAYAAHGWQSWIVTFGDAAERVLALRALLGVIVSYAGIGVLRRQCWAGTALATACGGAAVFGVVGVWSLLRWGWFRDTSLPFEAVLIAGVAGYALRLLCGDRARRQFAGTATLTDGRLETCGLRKGRLPGRVANQRHPY